MCVSCFHPSSFLVGTLSLVSYAEANIVRLGVSTVETNRDRDCPYLDHQDQLFGSVEIFSIVETLDRDKSRPPTLGRKDHSFYKYPTWNISWASGFFWAFLFLPFFPVVSSSSLSDSDSAVFPTPVGAVPPAANFAFSFSAEATDLKRKRQVQMMTYENAENERRKKCRKVKIAFYWY